MSVSEITTEETTAKAVSKRYEGLIMVRNKAIKGKGAWYWAHLEPLLVHNTDNGLPKSVKLKCCLCHTLFSASNPSRTASEHLKKGTCPNFTATPQQNQPQQQHQQLMLLECQQVTDCFDTNPRKRNCSSSNAGEAECAYVSPISVVDPTIKDDLLDARGLFEDSIKRLKSPKASPRPVLTDSQIDCAFDLLSHWLFDLCGSVSFSTLEHPKFTDFLHQVGLPRVLKTEFFGSRLDLKYQELRNECEVRVRDAQFFQLVSHGWRNECLVNFSFNLSNGTSVYRRAFFNGGGRVPCKYAEEVLWETISESCGGSSDKCVGIVSDKFNSTALRNLEGRNHWMVNLSCQYQAFHSLIKDFYKELPLFKTVAENCLKLANFVNNKTPVRNSFHKFHLREYGHGGLLFVPMKEDEVLNFEPVYAMVEDIMTSARVLQLVLLDESYKLVSMEDPSAREFGEMIRDVGFWNDLEAVRSLVRLVKEMANDFETERPLVGQCLPLWEELRSKVKDWCGKFHIDESYVDKVIERRFRKNYHPAWAASYILDPLYLIRDSSGKYLPPFKYLTPEQEKDVDKLITRLVSREEAHIVLMELMKWRTEGLDPVYAQAVQLKQRDVCSGKMKIANPQGSRLVWETYLPEFKSLGKVSVRLIFLHATARGFKCNSSFLRWIRSNARSRAGMERAQKMIFIAAHSRLERRDFTTDEDKDADLFASPNEPSDSDTGPGKSP